MSTFTICSPSRIRVVIDVLASGAKTYADIRARFHDKRTADRWLSYCETFAYVRRVPSQEGGVVVYELTEKGRAFKNHD